MEIKQDIYLEIEEKGDNCYICTKYITMGVQCDCCNHSFCEPCIRKLEDNNINFEMHINRINMKLIICNCEKYKIRDEKDVRSILNIGFFNKRNQLCLSPRDYDLLIKYSYQ